LLLPFPQVSGYLRRGAGADGRRPRRGLHAASHSTIYPLFPVGSRSFRTACWIRADPWAIMGGRILVWHRGQNDRRCCQLSRRRGVEPGPRAGSAAVRADGRLRQRVVCKTDAPMSVKVPFGFGWLGLTGARAWLGRGAGPGSLRQGLLGADKTGKGRSGWRASSYEVTRSAGPDGAGDGRQIGLRPARMRQSAQGSGRPRSMRAVSRRRLARGGRPCGRCNA
jgi:hypothetical protein